MGSYQEVLIGIIDRIITHIGGLTALLVTTHKPPNRGSCHTIRMTTLLSCREGGARNLTRPPKEPNISFTKE